MTHNHRGTIPLAILFVFLASCSSSPNMEENNSDANNAAATESTASTTAAPPSTQTTEATPQEDLYQIFSAKSSVIRHTSSGEEEDLSGEVTLNFQGADIGEVVKTVIGDILQRSYTIADGISGKVTLRTSAPIPRASLVPTLEALLKSNGAALLHSDGLYQVLPLADARVGGLAPLLRLSADRGHQLIVVPLRYIGVKEMLKILEPFKSERMLLQGDEYHNVLLLGGSYQELAASLDSIKIFDVDQLRGMSVGLFRLKNVEAESIIGELEEIFGSESDGPLSGLVRITPIKRLNALMVITPQEKYLRDVKTWVQRLDHSENASGMNMYVYYVQNGKSERLAEMLSELFAENRESRVRVSTNNQGRQGDTDAGTDNSRSNTEGTSVNVGDVNIIADEENNALLIMATPSDYAEVERALNKLDVVPMQVLVEASIVEVTLDDELKYGLQWFFKNGVGSNRDGRGGLNIPQDGISDIVPGFGSELPNFTYAVFDAVSTRVLLNALASDSRLNVVSSPSLMVLDNHKASIRVGDQVPVRTSETANTSGATTQTNNTTSALVTSTIQFRDTGVLLEVTPRVNAGGRVILEIAQEVNDVDRTTSSSIDSPTIIQRKIDTTVAVQSGETIVLGGLIRENNVDVNSGIPFLRDIPILGWFFSSKAVSTERTELVVMITPSAIANTDEARQVTDEYRDKFKEIEF